MSNPNSHSPDLASAARGEVHAPGVTPVRASIPGENVGDLIDRYELIEAIGEGGMGSVWMAEQLKPVERQVALKIIKLGMDTREVVARFDVERQALALMDHPNIARVFDGGATAGGRPYFVMELVRGVPITEYCSRASLGISERLELFVGVCGAIQHAHRKGIIHRDIKPSNVLVTRSDGVPVPKVIDFGIAKATSAEMAAKGLRTRLDQVIGTPAYMAPEQADGGGGDVDTRADVYSLGVLLYELLTGTQPFDTPAAHETGYGELLQTIRERRPPKPSTRALTTNKSTSKTTKDATSLSNRLRGDLDWIVMKALEKERSRRYGSAHEFAEDIVRYQAGKAVVAAPPSTSYRLRKLVQRRKKTIAALAAIVFLLIAGSIGTGIGWWKTNRANRDLAEALAEEARQAERATSAEAEASKRADELNQVATFQAAQLRDLDVQLMGVRMRADLIRAAGEGQSQDLTRVIEGLNFTSLALSSLNENVLGQTVDAIDAQFGDQPRVQARLLETIAITFRELGLLDAAFDPQQRALGLFRAEFGDEHPETLFAAGNMGTLLQRQGKLQGAEPYFQEALALRRIMGEEHPQTLTVINNMGVLLQALGRYSEADLYLQEALDAKRRVLGSESRSTLQSINNMGILRQSEGRLPEAEAYWREALDGRRRALGDDDPDTLLSINNMAGLLMSQRRFEESEALFREALEGRRQVLGDDHPDTLVSMNNMGSILAMQGRAVESEPYSRAALEGYRRILGSAHHHTLGAINNMATLLHSQGKLVEAEAHYREALAGSRLALGDDHPATLQSINSVGDVLRVRGKLSESEAFLQEGVEGARRVLGEEHVETLRIEDYLALLLIDLVESARMSADDQRLGEWLAKLGAHYLARGLHADAMDRLGESLDILIQVLPEGDWRCWRVQADLGAAIAGLGGNEEAEAMLQECIESLRATLQQDAALNSAVEEPLERAVGQLIELYENWHRIEPSRGFDAQARTWATSLEASIAK
ncbi:MAG: serine/threonine protein kinase [Chlamydiales bacterium]|jgi:serine/threonine protein kinase